MPESSRYVVVRGAREHNLKSVDLSFPRDTLTTFTGVSGSGKSSLAQNTIYQEGQRRFLESLSSYARQFLGRMEKPKVDHVEGLSPTVAIDQKSVGHSPRSTVGTLTELLDFLRLLYARLGEPSCPECGARIEAWSVERIVDTIQADHDGEPVLVLAPVVRERKGEYRQELAEYRGRGFVRARIDGAIRRLDEDIQLHRYKYHTIELVLDRLRLAKDKRSRLQEAVEQGIALAGGVVALLVGDPKEGEPQYRLFSTARACPDGHTALPELEPRLFSFNSPVGSCSACDGLGQLQSFSEDLLVPDDSLSLAEGAVKAFTAEGKMVYGRLGMEHLEQVGAECGFDLTTPWKQLSAKAKKVILHGSGKKTFVFRWQRQGANYRSSGRERRAYPGVIPHLESIYGGATARHLDRYRSAVTCASCEGARLNEVARAVRFRGRNLPELVADSVADVAAFFGALDLRGNEAAIGREIVVEIRRRLDFLLAVGLGYLTLERRANTLSGGESQRIRLAAQVGAGLRGILYVLDEPSIGLHPRDQDRLLATLLALRDRGNTVCVVEHDEATMLASDHLVDVGPGAGRHGGEIVASGAPSEVAEGDGLTARYLRGEVSIPMPDSRRAGNGSFLTVRGARHHNLKDVDLELPLGVLTCVTGVSGSGKSTLINHVLKRALRRDLHGALDQPGAHDRVEGIEHLEKLIEIDQSPIGRTPRSNPATYTKLWDQVRELFAQLPESRLREYKKGRFSFNVHGGRCESCEGAGVTLLEMQFLAPVEVVCDECAGQRFNPETLEVTFKDKNVADVLAMTVEEARDFFAAFPKIHRPLQTLCDVGLGYLHLGQPSTTLSGGEAQRVKLASELQRPASNGKTLYILDEPTTGLHFADIERLLAAMQRLVDAGNSMVVIEHNLDVIRSADHIVDLGPEGGPDGGTIVCTGTPEEVAKHPGSHTGRALAPLFRKRRSKGSAKPKRRKRQDPPKAIELRGAAKNNLQKVDVAVPHEAFTVITGVSGSGKTSLAFDTLFAEGQRRFIESLSTYARRFLGRLDRAPLDGLDGMGPAIAIDQRATHRSPRSTVATTTEVADYLRLLYARIGRPHCPEHGEELEQHPPSKIARQLLKEFEGAQGYLLAPVTLPAEWEGKADKMREFVSGLFATWREAGFVRALWDGAEQRLDGELPELGDPWPELFLVIDRVRFSERGRLVDGAAQAAEWGHGRVVVRTRDGEERVFSTHRACTRCGFTVPDQPHPRWFSFNHHSGACSRCAGLGQQVQCVPELLVNHPDKPLFGGAIKHKGGAFTFLLKKSGYFRKAAVAVAREEGFDLDAPWEELPASAQKLLMRGAGERRFKVKFRRQRKAGSRQWDMAVRWKGIARQIEEWYHGKDPDSPRGAGQFQPVMRSAICAECEGERLQSAQRHVLLGGHSLPTFLASTVEEARVALGKLRLRKTERQVAADVLREIENRLRFLDDVGLGYLTLNRSAATLSGGEAQRIRLATQLGNRLVGVTYVLDEPTIGLHPKDTERLLGTLIDLRDLGNTVIAVEHDEVVIRRADHVIDMGPGAGHRGGTVVAAGSPAQVGRSKGLTGRYLRGELTIPVPEERREAEGQAQVRGLSVHNLRKVSAEFPLGVLTAVTGVSGSGKSSLVMDGLLPALKDEAAKLRGVDRVNTVVVDQSPIGKTPSSNPATYTGIFTPIRELFAQLPQSKVKGFGPGRFSFNVAGGRCDACEGKGQVRVEMHFLADVWITCDVCRGQRFNSETLSVTLRDRNIAQVLAMEASEALEFFGNVPRVRRPLQLLVDVGLGYLRLGQAANTLSGGEAQRIKLVSHLARPERDHTVFLLDEPTTGLHLDDVAKLVKVLQRLVERGDTVIVIEHHLDVIKVADHVLEMGPGAGAAGGEIVFAGTPEEMARKKGSVTGPFLAEALRGQATEPARSAAKKASKTKKKTRRRAAGA